MRTRRHKIAISMMIVVVCYVPLFAHAQDSEVAQNTFQIITDFIKLLSWLWVVPATIAGKLLTNDLVYGSFFYLDRYLWQMRQFMRTMALYTLGFLLLVMVVKSFVKMEGPTAIFDTLKKVAIAGLLIPLTWWLMAAVIDLSIVMTAAVTSLPLEVMEEQWNGMEHEIKAPKVIEIKGKGFFDLDNISTPENFHTISLEDAMPQADSVAGPLVFLGTSILRLYEMNYVGMELDSRHSLTISAIINIIITIMFVLPLIVLMIVNMMRIFFIRLWIIFSPFVVLDQVFNGPLQKNYAKYFKLSNMLGLVFQPVVIVGLISLGLILVVGVYDVLLGGEEYERDSLEEMLCVNVLNDSTTQVGCPRISEMTIKGELFQSLGVHVGGAIGEMILVFFVVFLLWGLMRAGFKTSEITSGVADGMFRFGGDMVKSMNVLPGGMSLAGLEMAKRQVEQGKLGFKEKQDKEVEAMVGRIEEQFGLSEGEGLKETQLGRLTRAVNEAKGSGDKHKVTDAFRGAMRAVLGETSFTGDDPNFKRSVQHWLSNGGMAYLSGKFPGMFSGEEQEEFKTNPSIVRKNQKFTKYLDVMLTNDVTPGQGDELYRAGQGRSNISSHTYGQKEAS